MMGPKGKAAALAALWDARVAEAEAALVAARAEQQRLQAEVARLVRQLPGGPQAGGLTTVEALWGAVRWAGRIHTEVSRREMEELEISRRIRELQGKLVEARRRREVLQRWLDRQARQTLRARQRLLARNQEETAAARFRRG
ncbi:protein of unknown function [Candidatus Hydrogenisulfobacillus filiaventi]|uniref:Flagellar FliJ protein n=1 Tax=Candidatus Hydrogenisulfobacillus filiaventi TaxID=2707344 RepID=A0A6F8ZEE4_9FIRM|nr:hypothetical protein [Bacillota bacterium]CAB1128013.1 protein of unknown function [Candidatus Hydrogenisulfobacillus filiaventi]